MRSWARIGSSDGDRPPRARSALSDGAVRDRRARSRARRPCTLRPPISIASAPTSSSSRRGSQPTRTARCGGDPRRPSARIAVNGWGASEAFAAEFCALGGSVQRVWTPVFGPAGPLLRRSSARRRRRRVVALRVREPRRVHPRVPGAATQTRGGRCCSACGPSGRFPPKRRLWPRLRGVAGQHRRSAQPIVHARGRLPRGLREGVPRVAARRRDGIFVVCSRTTTPSRPLVESLEKTAASTRRRARRAACSTGVAATRDPGRPGAARRQPPGGRAGARSCSSTAARRVAPSFHPVRTIPAVDETLGGLLAPRRRRALQAPAAVARRHRPGHAELSSPAAGSSR